MPTSTQTAAEHDDYANPPPLCMTCWMPMPTPAHVFLHAQTHGEARLGYPQMTLRALPMALYDRVAKLMQDYAESQEG